MKLKMILYMLIVAATAATAVLVTQSCRKAVGPIDIPASTDIYKMKGLVLDAKTNAAIAGAKVNVLGTIVVSDASGFFSFEIPNTTVFPFTIYAKADNHVYGNGLITGPSQVRAIMLTPTNPAVVIGPAGGEVVAKSDESVSEDSLRLIIPAGALGQSVSISVTPMDNFFASPGGMKTAPKVTITNLNLLAFSVDPDDVVFIVPVQIYCPLPFYNDVNAQFTLYQLNTISNQWEDTGRKMTVDATRTGGFAQIMHGGIYSVGGQGTYNEVIASQSLLFTFNCNGDTTIQWMAQCDFPQGYPDSVSVTWLMNTVSDYSTLGGHVSFFDATFSTIICEPIEPSPNPPPVNPADTNEIIIPIPPVCPSGAHAVLVDDGKSWERRIINGSLTYFRFRNGAIVEGANDKETVQVPVHRYHWVCVHDQGGGK